MSAANRGYKDFFRLPTSASGWATAVMALVVVVSVTIMAVLVEPAQPAWRGAFALFLVATVVATAVCGVVAVLHGRERSWAVVIPTVACLVIVLNELAQQVRAWL